MAEAWRSQPGRERISSILICALRSRELPSLPEKVALILREILVSCGFVASTNSIT